MRKRYSRNEALFGNEGQMKIATTKVAIAGLGGLGSHVAQQLVYLGVGDYGLIDFDIVTPSSLNRLVGAVDSDVSAKTKKVAVSARTIAAVKPDATIRLVDGRVSDTEAERTIARADVVFGCVDRDIHRLELTALCARYAKPYIDLASDTDDEGDGLVYGGRVVFCDGNRCLVCLPGVLNQVEIARDRMTPEQRDVDRRIYGVDRERLDSSGPSVVSINGVIASLAVTEFMVFVTGLRQPAAQLTYRADHGTVRAAIDLPAADCYYCTGLWGTAVSGSDIAGGVTTPRVVRSASAGG